MATQRQSHKDSMDDPTESKQYSDSLSDNEDSPTPNNHSNNFMNQVHQRRKNSISYTGDQASDSPLVSDDIMSPRIIDECKYDKPLISTSHSAFNPINFMKRQPTDHLLNIDSIKLRRRHSADKILSKPSLKNTNSVDYLNRMVITLRSKITTYKEDLRIAGELGQNLFSQNSKKDLLIQQYEQDVYKLKSLNDELSNINTQLHTTTKIDAEHIESVKKEFNRQTSKHGLLSSKYQEECVLLREQLEHCKNDIKHLEQFRESQRLEIETLETRNEQISLGAGETIDDLSRELAEEKDGHSNLKHKYQKLHSNFTKLKINYEKRGTEINNLRKELHDKELKILTFENNGNANTNANGNNSNGIPINKQQIKLLYRQIDNYKEEIEGMQTYIDNSKTYLKTTVDYLENTNLLMKPPDIDQIYTLCENARQFLGINKPPPDPVYSESPEPPPMPPKEPSLEPPTDGPSLPDAPREPTPPLKVSQREVVPLSVPAAPKTPTPPPIQPPSLPNTNPLPSQPIQKPIKPVKVRNKPSLPPSIPPSIPSEPKPSNPLPPPKTHIKKTKIYNTAQLPQIRENPKLPPPNIPNPPTSNNNIPLPKEVKTPKPKRFSSAITPERKVKTQPPQMPSMPTQPPMVPSMPKQPQIKSKINANAMMPKAVKVRGNPKLPPPNIPNPPTNNIPLPKEEIKKKTVLVNRAMSPPKLPPSAPPTNVNDSFVPQPRMEEQKQKMENVKGKIQENNKPKKKKKSKKKKPKKERDSMEEQKQHLVIFFSTYSDSKNWGEGGKDHGVQKYILKFAEREPLNARMAFLYSMTLYLGQIVGVNKRCISHAFMLFKSVRAQIDTLCEEFALILQTLEHHNDDKLWKYVYSFLYNAAAYFKHIQRFVGTRTSVDNPRGYQKQIKSQSRDYTSRNSSITFRKVSGLSDLSEMDNRSNLSSKIVIADKKHQVYGNVSSNNGNSKKNSNKKKKKSSYA